IPIGPKDKARNPHASDDADAKDDDDKAKWEAEAKEKAEQVHKLATAKNADFEALAREHSSGPSAMKGGDIGIFTEDRMAEEFSKAAFKLKVGEISKPVKTKFGYHIIKVTGKWPAGELPKDALEDQIVSRLQQRKLHQGRRELKEELLEKYEIVDHIKPTLGPEPEKKSRRKPMDPHKAAERRKAMREKRAAAHGGEGKGDDGHDDHDGHEHGAAPDKGGAA